MTSTIARLVCLEVAKPLLNRGHEHLVNELFLKGFRVHPEKLSLIDRSARQHHSATRLLLLASGRALRGTLSTQDREWCGPYSVGQPIETEVDDRSVDASRLSRSPSPATCGGRGNSWRF